jgi:hypothetical protein
MWIRHTDGGRESAITLRHRLDLLHRWSPLKGFGKLSIFCDKVRNFLSGKGGRHNEQNVEVVSICELIDCRVDVDVRAEDGMIVDVPRLRVLYTRHRDR